MFLVLSSSFIHDVITEIYTNTFHMPASERMECLWMVLEVESYRKKKAQATSLNIPSNNILGIF